MLETSGWSWGFQEGLGWPSRVWEDPEGSRKIQVGVEGSRRVPVGYRNVWEAQGVLEDLLNSSSSVG